MKWLRDFFKVEKPLTAMCHFQTLPGDPEYGAQKRMKWIVGPARADLLALQAGGGDGLYRPRGRIYVLCRGLSRHPGARIA